MRPEGLELSTFWFVAEQGQNLSSLFGVACEATHDTLTRAMRPRDLSFKIKRAVARSKTRHRLDSCMLRRNRAALYQTRAAAIVKSASIEQKRSALPISAVSYGAGARTKHDTPKRFLLRNSETQRANLLARYAEQRIYPRYESEFVLVLHTRRSEKSRHRNGRLCRKAAKR